MCAEFLLHSSVQTAAVLVCLRERRGALTWASEVFIAFSVGSRNCRTNPCCQQLQDLDFKFWDNLGHHTFFFRLLGQNIPLEAQRILQPPTGVRKQWGQSWHSQTQSSGQRHTEDEHLGRDSQFVSRGHHRRCVFSVLAEVWWEKHREPTQTKDWVKNLTGQETLPTQTCLETVKSMQLCPRESSEWSVCMYAHTVDLIVPQCPRPLPTQD